MPRLAALLLTLAALAAAAFAGEAVDDEVSIVRYSVVRVRRVDPLLAEVEIRAKARNSRGASFTAVSAQFTPPAGLPITSAYPFLHFPDIGSHARVTSTDTLIVQLPKRNLRAFKKALKRGTAFTVDFTADEVPDGAGNLVEIDAPTCAAFNGPDPNAPPLPAGLVRYLFDETPLLATLQPGDILIETGCRSCGVSDLPWRIANVTLNGTTAEVTARPVASLQEMYRNATFTAGAQLFSQAGGPNATGALQARDAEECEDGQLDGDGIERIYTPTGFFFRFNDIELAPGVKMSGSIAVGSAGFDLEIRVRDGEISRVALSTEVFQHLTVEVAASAQADFPRVERDLLLPFALPVFHTNIGGFPVQVTPQLRIYVGGEGHAESGIVMGGVQSSTAHFEAAVEDGVAGASATFDVEPLQLSPPQITSETAASVRLFGGVELILDIDWLGGPYAKIEGYVNLDVDPSATPWWDLSVGARTSAGMLFAPLGIDIAEADFPIDLWPHDGLEAPASGDGVPGSRTSGTAQRWAKVFDLPSGVFDYADDVVVASDGSLLVTATELGSGYLVKLDPDGSPLFAKQFTSSSWAQGVADLPGEGAIVAGDTGSAVWAARLDTAGAVEWIKEYDLDAPGYVADTSLARVVDPASGAVTGVVIAGQITVLGDQEGFIVRLGTDGTLLWAKHYDLPGFNRLYDVRQTSDGGFVACGYLNVVVPGVDDPGNGTGWVMKLDANGDVEWSKGVGSSNASDDLYAIAEAADGGFVCVGSTYTHPRSEHEALMMVKLTPQGDASFLTTYAGPPDFTTEPSGPVVSGDSYYDAALDIVKMPYGFLVAGRTGLADVSSGWLLRIDDQCDIVWWQTMDGYLLDDFSALADAGDGVVAIGASKSFTAGDQDLLVARLPYDGMLHLAPVSLGFTNYSNPSIIGLGGNGITAGSADVTPSVTDSVVTERTAVFAVNDIVLNPSELVQR